MDSSLHTPTEASTLLTVSEGPVVRESPIASFDSRITSN